MPVVTIFGSFRSEEDSFEYRTASKIGKLLSQKGCDIATGGYGGAMEAALKGASGNDVKKIGVTTGHFENREKNAFVSHEIKAETYLDRLKEMVNIGDAYIVLPGGTGSLLELAAVWALKERGLIGGKPLVCIGDQWNEVIQTMGFYSESAIDRFDLIYHADDAEEAVDYILKHLENLENK